MTTTQPSPVTGKLLHAEGVPGGADLDADLLGELRSGFASQRHNKLMQNAVTQTALDDVALNRDVVTATDHTFSHKLDDWAVTNQQKSGRCWMFAAMNLFRVGAMRTMNLKDFEFSQNYTLFWDKLERSNYFLEAIIDTADKPSDDRVVAFLLENPLDDGGQWNMFINIVRKHGLVPKAVMPETQSSSNTQRMNSLLISRLREAAKTLRDLHGKGESPDDLRKVKREILTVIHRMLCIHLGTPPTEFDWQWNDKDKEFHRDGTLTPQQFVERYVSLPLDDYVCLVHDPRETSPVGRTFTVQYLGNVVGGEIVKYLNVEIDVMKQAAIKLIESGEPVWFGCDVAKMMQRQEGLWDANLYEYGEVYDAPFTLDKAGRLEYHDTVMTHAMLFTGVDVVDGAPRRWRVENSWGEDNGKKGFYTMNDNWFDEYMYEVACPKRLLAQALQDAAEAEPIVLPPWDPMGALARG
jgi:bleomycin hydrolase